MTKATKRAAKQGRVTVSVHVPMDGYAPLTLAVAETGETLSGFIYKAALDRAEKINRATERAKAA